MLSDHGREVCSCGELISQCRCLGPHIDTIIPNGCFRCRAKARGLSDREMYHDLIDLRSSCRCSHCTAGTRRALDVLCPEIEALRKERDSLREQLQAYHDNPGR